MCQHEREPAEGEGFEVAGSFHSREIVYRDREVLDARRLSAKLKLGEAPNENFLAVM